MVEEEKFFAWLDGELGPEEAAQVEAAVSADPKLSRMAEEHRAMAAGFRRAFDAVATAPVPERIVAAARGPQDNVVEFAAHREKRRTTFGAPQWAAIAAALAVGVALGTTLNIGGGAGPVEVKGGKVYAASAVDRALDSQLASSAPSEIRIGLTYRDKAGAICRTFQDDSASGLACREDGNWRIRGLFQGSDGQSSDYRMASGPDPRLMDLVDESIAGEPFDQAQERAALARHWR